MLTGFGLPVQFYHAFFDRIDGHDDVDLVQGSLQVRGDVIDRAGDDLLFAARSNPGHQERIGRTSRRSDSSEAAIMDPLREDATWSRPPQNPCNCPEGGTITMAGNYCKSKAREKNAHNLRAVRLSKLRQVEM